MYYVSKEFRCQVLASTPVFFNEFLIGLGYGWVAPIIRLLRDTPVCDPLSVTNDQASWIASLHNFGYFLAPLISLPLLNLVGRKGLLTLASITLFVSFALIALIQSIPVIYSARLIFGLAVGFHESVVSIYLCENCTPSFRGVFGAVAVACLYGGSFVEFSCANFLSYTRVAYTNTTVAFITLLASIFVSTETPDYLITKGEYDEALKNFLRLRGKEVATADVIEEFEKLKRHIESQRERGQNLMALLRTASHFKWIVVVTVVGLLTSATGFDAINSYVSITFTISGVFTPNEYTMVFGGLQFVSAALGTFVIEKVDRRTILMISLAVSTIVHAFTALLFYLRTTIPVPYFSWCTFGSITIFSMVYSSSILPIYATLVAELLPLHARPIGVVLTSLAFSSVSFLITKVFLIVSEMFGLYWNFVFYSLASSTFVLIVYVTVPETRNRSLIEIQKTEDD